MSKWCIYNSFHKKLYARSAADIESWNDVVFLYSKIMNDRDIFKRNYMLFSTSTNAPFSRDEVLSSLEFVFQLLHNENFSKTLDKMDLQIYYDLFQEIKSAVSSDEGHTFTTSIADED